MIETHDQLKEAMGQGYYPNYKEMEIKFDPSYKMSVTKVEYVNKKDQAPSYCDRVLYKNNTPLKLEEMSYECHHDVFGSDHRAVSAHLKIKNFGMQNYCDLQQMLDIQKPVQGYGELSMEMVDISNFNLN